MSVTTHGATWWTAMRSTRLACAQTSGSTARA